MKTQQGGSRGYDGGKKMRGRKRHLLVDTLGLLLKVVVLRQQLNAALERPEWPAAARDMMREAFEPHSAGDSLIIGTSRRGHSRFL